MGKWTLPGLKSYIAGVGLMLTGIAQEIEKNMEAGMFAILIACLTNQQVLLGLSIMGLRAGISKSGPGKEKAI